MKISLSHVKCRTWLLSLALAASGQVFAQNAAPVAADDQYQTNEDQNMVVNAPGLLGNDTDAENDFLTASLYYAPQSGAVVVNADGSFTYFPGNDFHGMDVFVYEVCDGIGGCDTASVFVNVISVNDAPFASDDDYFLAEDNQLNVPAPGVLDNDLDIEGDAMTAKLISGPSAGNLVMNANGSFTYNPPANFSGFVFATYRAYDAGGDSADAQIVISVTPVNDAPVSQNESYNLVEETPLSVPAPGVLANDADVENSVLTASGIAQPPAHGIFNLSPNGAFTYTPDADYFGADSVSYIVQDAGGAKDTGWVFFQVSNVNDSPRAADDFYQVAEDMVLNVPAPGVTGNDIEPDGDNMLTGLVIPAENGEVLISSDGSFRYDSDAQYFGSDSFAYRVIDLNGGADTAWVYITVLPVNDNPRASNDEYSVAEDDTLRAALPGVLRNDRDIDSDSLRASVVTSVRNGSLTLNADGSFEYIPLEDFSGADSFIYRACDDADPSLCNSALVYITVTPSNDKPVAVSDTALTTRNIPVTVAAPGLLANDSDPENDVLTATVLGNPLHGTIVVNPDGSFTYSPAFTYVGNDSVRYRACDAGGLCDTAWLFLTVEPGTANEPPRANSDSIAVNEDAPYSFSRTVLLNNDVDPEGGTLTFTIIQNPANGSLVQSGNMLVYTSSLNYNGADQFRYRICDPEGLCDSTFVKINVRAVNDKPVALDDQYSTTRNTVLNVPANSVYSNDSDIDGDNLTATLIGNAAKGTVVINANRSLTYTPATDYSGLDSARYRVCDGGGLCDTAMIRFTITFTNRPPVGQDDNFTTIIDQPVSGNVLSNDSDPDGDPLEATLASTPANGTVSLAADGNFTYTPNAGYVGADSYTYNACDNGNPKLCVLKTVNINILGIPEVGLAKRVSAPVRLPDGTYNIPYLLTLSNSGSTTLTSIQVVDDLRNAFPDPIEVKVVGSISATEGLTPNNNFNGLSDINLLSGTNSLAAGKTATVIFTINIKLNGMVGQFNNSAIVSAKNGTVTLTDFSQNGSNPDPDEDGDPENNSEPTPVSFSAQVINGGIAKRVLESVREVNGTYKVTYQISLRNYGNVVLQNISVTDDLMAAFPAPASFFLESAPKTTGALIPNSSFDGRGNNNLLSQGSLLGAGSAGTITFTVVVLTGNAALTSSNSARMEAEGEGLRIADESVDGSNPDPDGNGVPDEMSPSVISMEPTVLFVSGGFSPDGDGTNDYFVLENIGTSVVGIEIFNRWGKVVYTSANYQNDWNGTSEDGDPLPDGTYFYLINLNNGQEKISGFLTINR